MNLGAIRGIHFSQVCKRLLKLWTTTGSRGLEEVNIFKPRTDKSVVQKNAVTIAKNLFYSTDYQTKLNEWQSDSDRSQKVPPKMPSIFWVLHRISWRTTAAGVALVFPMLFLEFMKPSLLR